MSETAGSIGGGEEQELVLPTIRRSEVLLILVQIGILASHFWKYEFFAFAWSIYQQTPMDIGFFPPAMRSASVMGWLFVAVVVSTAVAIVAGPLHMRNLRLGAVVIQWLAIAGLCLHQATYNDATFTTMWWTSTFSLWLAGRLRGGEIDEPAVLRRAAFLAGCIVSMILLGGAVGKWTADYWSGQVLYDIYFVDRDFWTFNQLRSWYEPETQRWIAIYYSRMVVLTETVFGLTLWMLPPRWSATAGMLLLSSIAIFSNFLLFSVMACLIAMMSAGLFVRPETIEDGRLFGRRPKLLIGWFAR